ncbi:transcriptional regulator [Streptomyces sp. WAC 01529]|uniref:helix-turn-helix domain-containing protein n=1 Tax=Streptomyces sp. WAC 01529 TaxID=2203205 RepID=UPI000F6B83C5|nr:helix-turn-helix transcriptional regulator [Streptomyces sp. WAC 01529]AZM51741.1 transcriptional regulator [Streptomyces sp. WAC 01529]
MSTDYQQAREALGQRLKELRVQRPGGRLTGPQLAGLLGWPHSKIYKLEGGKQTATREDLRAWADTTGRPEAFGELAARLSGFETQIRSWRRQLANGHRPVQERWNAQIERTAVIHAWEESAIPGMLQNADYARHVFARYADLHGSARDIEEAVRSRAQRQEWLFQAGHRFRVIIWEAALRSLICPPSVLAAQLDRLAGVIGVDTVELGIIPFTASVKIAPANGFWILDERLVIAEDWHAELWLDDADSIALYAKVWRTLRESAVYGADAHNIINAARRALTSR